MYRLPPHIRTFILVPAYNEQHETVKNVLHALLPLAADIILVDDGSTEPLPNPYPGRVHLVRHAHNLGQGASLQTGFLYAKIMKADYVVTFDADGQHQPEDIPALLGPLIRDEADIVLGSRFTSGGSHNASRGRRLILFLARMINTAFTGIQLTDAHNGLRALNKKALDLIHLTENRMAHATEIIHQIKKFKLRYREVPVHILYSPYSRKKGQSIFNSIRIFFDLVLHKLLE